MPHISLTLYKGREKEDLEVLAKKLRSSLDETWDNSAISVSIKQVEPDNFTKEVNTLIDNGDDLVLESDYYKK